MPRQRLGDSESAVSMVLCLRGISASGNLPTCPGWDSNPGRGERQRAVSGGALDHTTVRAGPLSLLGLVSCVHE